MKKTAVIYWSGTGNTEAMANAVLEGMKAAGAEATLLTPDQVDASALSDYDAIAFGCPAMGSEVLEESEFEPMFDGCKNSIGGKRVALFGSYGGWCSAGSSKTVYRKPENIAVSAFMAFSTVSLNFAGCAVSQNTPVSPSSSISLRA